jgi:hypothetical protein
MKLKLTFLFLIVIATCKYNLVSAQMTDSTKQIINRLLQIGYEDTSDLEDFFIVDTISSEPGGGNDAKLCKKHFREQATSKITLVTGYPYFEIYKDEFNQLDKKMWVNDATDFDYFIGFQENADFDDLNQGMYLNKNISVVNDKLILGTKEENITVGWRNHKYWPWPFLEDGVTPTPQKTIPYTSARAQSRWAFDGDFTINDGVVSDDEGGIVVEAKIKYPTVDGTFPAFWMMGYDLGEYDEFDIFEFFENEFDKMWVSLYKDGSDITQFRCSEDFNVQDLQDKFCFYYFIWNRHHIAVYVSLDNKKFDKLYMRHQFARNHRVGSFRCQKEIDENEWYRRRRQFCENPMRINFNTAVHPPPESGKETTKENRIATNLSAKYEVEYVKVYKQMKCPVESVTTYNEKSDFMLREGVYNVVTAKKAIIDFPVQNMPHLGSGECVKIICEEHVEVNQLKVDPMGEFRIEHVDNVCESDFTPPSETSVPPIETEVDVPYYVYNKQWQITNKSEFSTLNKEQIQVVLYDIGGRKIQSFNLYEWENIGELSDRYKSGTYVLVLSNSDFSWKKSQLIYIKQ